MTSMILRAAGALALAALLAGSFAGPAAAVACVARHKICLDYCKSRYPGDGVCTGRCADSQANCLRTGCWVSQLENKCGYEKR